MTDKKTPSRMNRRNFLGATVGGVTVSTVAWLLWPESEKSVLDAFRKDGMIPAARLEGGEWEVDLNYALDGRPRRVKDLGLVASCIGRTRAPSGIIQAIRDRKIISLEQLAAPGAVNYEFFEAFVRLDYSNAITLDLAGKKTAITTDDGQHIELQSKYVTLYTKNPSDVLKIKLSNGIGNMWDSTLVYPLNPHIELDLTDLNIPRPVRVGFIPEQAPQLESLLMTMTSQSFGECPNPRVDFVLKRQQLVDLGAKNFYNYVEGQLAWRFFNSTRPPGGLNGSALTFRIADTNFRPLVIPANSSRTDAKTLMIDWIDLHKASLGFRAEEIREIRLRIRSKTGPMQGR